MDKQMNEQDHDLLIRIDEKLELLIKTKEDQEKRLRRLELVGSIAIGLSYAITFYFQFLK